METNRNKFEIARENKISDFAHDPNLSTKIPQIVEQLFYEEFGINLPDVKETVPIAFEVGWKNIKEYVEKQPTDEFAIDICGVSFEYTTELVDAEKGTNITPHLVHLRNTVFMKNEHSVISGADYKSSLMNRYNTWRTVNLQETIASIENKIYTELIDVYGIDLTVPCAVFPLLAAIYAAAVQVTREMCKNADYDPSTYLELYNVMAIRVDEDETVLLRPLRTLKEGVKGDSKIADMHVDMM